MAAKLICPNCGFSDNPTTTRFCGQCASRLPTPCPICGATNPPGFRFCGQCASPLGGTSPLQSIQRVISVLFADVCNSTELTNTLGAERMYTLLDSCLRRLGDAVRRHEGTIDKITGDGLMAVFGMPTTLEQHAVQACFSALAMLEELALFNEELAAESGLQIQIRVGVASGKAVSGGLGSDRSTDVTVIGEVVNLAARLQQEAAPNSILLDQQAVQLAGALFNLTPVPPLALKGFAAPVPAWRLDGRREQPGNLRGIGGEVTPLVGREVELAQLTAAIAPLMEGKGGVVWLAGEAGIGKSRLTHEALDRAREALSFRTLEGDSFSHTRTMPYNVFMGVIRDFCAILPTDDRAAVRAKVQRVVESLGLPDPQEVVPYLEYLLSIDLLDESLLARVRHLPPEQLKQRVFLAVRTLLRAEAQRQPLVLVLDDLQWADELSSDLIPFLTHSLHNEPILFYLIARGEYQPFQRLMLATVMEQAGERGLFMRLHPLAEREQREMARTLLPEAEEATIKELVAHAEGLPYYLEELVRHRLEAPAGNREVPTSLAALIRARYDRLPEPLQSTLAKAAVIGRRFPVPLLGSLQGRGTEEALKALHQRAFVRPRRANPNEWTFEHGLTQETVYQSLLERERRHLHEQVGESLERMAGERLDEQVGVLAYHFSRSNDQEKAIRYLLRAGARAAGRYANEEALRLFAEATEFIEQAPERYQDERVTLAREQGEVLALTGQYEEARAAFQQALALVPGVVPYDPVRHARLERRLASTFEQQDRYDEAQAHLLHARQLLADRDVGERARILADAGWIAFVRGEMEAATTLLHHALADARAVQDLSVQATIYNRLAGIYYRRMELARAKEILAESLAVRQQLDDQLGIAGVLTNMGVIAQQQSLWAEAESYYQQSRQIALRNGATAINLNVLLNLATVAVMRGQFADAIAHTAEAQALAQESNQPYLQTIARMLEGLACLHAGDLVAARRSLIQAWCLFRAKSLSPAEGADVVELLGRIAAREGRDRVALLLARKALRLAQQAKGSAEHFRAKRLLAYLHAHEGHLVEAEVLLDQLAHSAGVGSDYEQALLYVVRADYHQRQGHIEKARAFEEQAQSLFSTHHIPPPLRQFA